MMDGEIMSEKAKAKPKLKVMISFTDKYTGKCYKVGDIISPAEKRAKELLADTRGLVEKCE